MKKTLTLALVLSIGSCVAQQSLPVINVRTNNVAVTQSVRVPTVTTVTNYTTVASTNLMLVATVDPLTLTQTQMDGIIAMVQASGIKASTPLNTTNLLGLSVYRGGGTNGVPVTYTARFQLLKP